MSGESKLGSTEHLFKVLVIGDSDVGKTSFVKRYVRNQFFEDLKSTIGVDFSMKVIEWDSQTLVRLQLWDIGVLLANKCDQIKLCQQNAAVLEKLCQEKGFIGWFETSAKDNFNVDTAAKFLVKHILQANQESANEEVQEIQINLTQQSNTNSTCC